MRYTLLILTLVLLSGCGSKGPLFLPKDESASAQAVSTKPEAAQPAEAPPSDQPPAAGQGVTPQDTEEESAPKPVQEQEDDQDIKL